MSWLPEFGGQVVLAVINLMHQQFINLFYTAHMAAVW